MSIEETGLARLPGKLNKPNTRKLLSRLLRPMDEVTESIRDIGRSFGIASAFGDIQDLLGKVIGFARTGLQDEEYRILQLAAAAANRSQTDVESLINVCNLTLGIDCDVTVVMAATCVVRVQIHSPVVTEATALQLLDFLQKSASVGVRVSLEYSTTPDADTFTLSECCYFDADVLAGATAIAVRRTANFPATGQVLINFAETHDYTAVDDVSITLATPTLANYLNGTPVELVATGKGLGTTADPALGGKLSNVRSFVRT